MFQFQIRVHRRIKGTARKTLEKKSNHLLNQKLASIIDRVEKENGKFKLTGKDGAYSFEAKGYSPELLKEINKLLQ
ncbi:MAG TPA: hypothetical protein VEV83_07080 [Parafilimonas sp.]|nr:hypothetical protein [Parafilimonas sp.]